MTHDPLVSVYLPCRNYGRYLKKAVESVLEQQYENWELFIFDEASDDQTFEIAREYERNHPNKIKVTKFNEPQGLQKIANRVLNCANGKYIMRLDADDWLDENALLVMVSKLESDDQVGLVYPNYFYADQSGKVIGIERRLQLWEEDISGYFPPHGACSMVRTRSLKSVGGYTESINAQDGWELWYKLRNRIKSASINLPLFYYRQHDHSLSKDQERLLSARAKIIKKLAKRLQGDYQPTVLVVIPVRENFDNFPSVPFQNLGMKSLLQIAIDSVSDCDQVDEVLIISSSQNVLDFSESLEITGSVCKHTRVKKSENLGPNLDIETTLKLAAQSFMDTHSYFPDIILLANLHAVGRKGVHVEKAINMLLLTESDSVVTVQEEREPLFRQSINGVELLNPGRFDGLTLSKEREKVFRFNGCLIGSWWEVIQEGKIFDGYISQVEMSTAESIQVKTLEELKKLNH